MPGDSDSGKTPGDSDSDKWDRSVRLKPAEWEGSKTVERDGSTTPEWEGLKTPERDGSTTPEWEGLKTPEWEGSFGRSFGRSFGHKLKTVERDGSTTAEWEGSKTPEWEGSFGRSFGRSFGHKLTKVIEEYAKPAQKDLPRRTIFQLPWDMMEGLDRHGIMCYTPETMSLGLFHMSERYPSVNPTKGEDFKLQMAGAFLSSRYLENFALDLKSRSSESKSQSVNLNMEEGVPLLGLLKSEDIAETSSKSSEVVIPIVARDAEHVGNVVESSGQMLRRTNGVLSEWRNLCRLVVVEEWKKVLDCYEFQRLDELREQDVMTLQSGMTVDAIAVGCLFGVNYCRNIKRMFPFPLIEDCVDKQAVYGGLQVADFLKLENQIPLFLLRNVLHLVWSDPKVKVEKIIAWSDPKFKVEKRSDPKFKVEKILNDVCAKVVRDFAGYLPGCDLLNNELISRFEEGGDFGRCDHLLDCVALVLRRPKDFEEPRELQTRTSSVSDLRSVVATNNLFSIIKAGIFMALRIYKRFELGRGITAEKFRVFKIPSATLLRKSGISVRGRAEATTGDLLPIFKHNWLEIYATLYIPRIPILSNVTWTLWRNILAYEHERNRQRIARRRWAREHPHEESQLHAFLALMHCLIDTKDDVMLLMGGDNPVLPPGFLSKPEDIATVFSEILKGQPFVDYPRWVALANEIQDFQKLRPLLIDKKRQQLLYLSFLIILLTLISVLTVYTISAYYNRY